MSGQRVMSLLTLFVVGGFAAAAANQEDQQALQRMVASERAFAAATAEIGVRDGFLTFFAPDAVQIAAGAGGADVQLVSARTALAARPLPRLPLGATLMWNPHTGQVSGDGSLGWLTGPFVVMNAPDRSLAGQGSYFSVWKRQPDGLWRVWLDEGIELPEVWTNASEFRAAPSAAGGEGGSPGETVEQAEAEVAAGGRSWTGRWSDSVRIHRNGRLPMVGREAAEAWAVDAWTEVRFQVIRIEAAASNDLAVAIGGYEARSTAGPERGSWVRVWAREAGGLWRVVFETNKAAG